MAGVPFDVLENLSTRGTTQAARELIARQAEFSQAKTEVEQLLASLKAELSKEQFRSWRKAIRSGLMPATVDPFASLFVDRWPKSDRVALAESRLRNVMAKEVMLARDTLHGAVRKFLAAYLVFAAPGVRERLIRQLAGDTPLLSPRNKQARADERHWLLYLQRLAAKNDSLKRVRSGRLGSIRRRNSEDHNFTRSRHRASGDFPRTLGRARCCRRDQCGSRKSPRNSRLD